MTTNILEKALETNREQFIDELMSARTRHMLPELNDTVSEFPVNHFRLVLNAVGLTCEQATTPCRKHKYVIRRYSCYKYLRLMGYSTVHIGRLFNRNHATVIKGINTFDTLLSIGYTPVVKLNDIVEQLYNETKCAKYEEV